MKRWIAFPILFGVALAAGILIGQRWNASPAPADDKRSASNEREALYYKAPMDPNYRSDQPGKSPMGMDLVPVYADEADDTEIGVVRLSPTVVNNLGVRTAEVQQGPLARTLSTVGYVGYNEDSLYKVSPRVAGWVEKLSVKAMGEPVSSGQVLFKLYSPTLVNAQEEFLAALNSRNTALHDASGERLIALGIAAPQIATLERERRVQQRIDVIAASDGVMVHLGVREGQYITAADDFMEIGALDEVWINAEVLERQAAWVAKGQRALVTSDAYPGRQWAGTVDFVYPELDPATRTLNVRIRLPNPERHWLPNMFARATIIVPPSGETLYIPRGALIPDRDGSRVVVVLGEGQYQSRVVNVGIESGDFVEIRRGLASGDRVVTSGQFLIDSESNVDSALARMESRNTNHTSHDRGAMDHKAMEAEADAHSRHDMGDTP